MLEARISKIEARFGFRRFKGLEPDQMDINQLSEYTGYTIAALRQAKFHNLVPYHAIENTVGGKVSKKPRIYFEKSEIDKWIEAGGIAGAVKNDNERLRQEIAARELNLPQV